MTNVEIILAISITVAAAAAFDFALKRFWMDLRTVLDLRRQRRRGIRRGKREEESQTQRLEGRLRSLDRLAKQVEKNLREKQSKEAQEERRQLPISNYEKSVDDEALYAPNLGNVGDPTTDGGDDVQDVYRGSV